MKNDNLCIPEVTLVCLTILFIIFRHAWPYYVKIVAIIFIITALLSVNLFHYLTRNYKSWFNYPKYLGISFVLIGVLFRLEHWTGYGVLFILAVFLFLFTIGHMIYESGVHLNLFRLIVYSALILYAWKSLKGF